LLAALFDLIVQIVAQRQNHATTHPRAYLFVGNISHRRSYFGDDVPEDIDDCEQVRHWTLGWPKEALAIAET
jgi:hypothetical protein